MAVVAVFSLWCPAATAEDDWIGTPLTSAAIIETFTRNYLLGEDDDGQPFVLHFKVGGDVEIRLADGRGLTGSWVVGDGNVCVTWHDTAAESCHDVYLDGNVVNFATAADIVRSTQLRLDPPDWLTP